MLNSWMDVRKLFIGVLFCCITDAYPNGSQPEQIHLSFGDDIHSMVVMWSSRDDVKYNVTYGTSRDWLTLNTGSDVVHQPEVAAHAAPFVHRATLKNLSEDTPYFYRITPLYPDNRTLHFESDVYRFKTLSLNKSRPLKFLVYGDMGTTGDIPTYDMVNRLVDSDEYSAVWHVGDFAYDLKDDLGKVGDTFFNRIQPFAARVPYMPSPGNHEIYDDFVHYRLRFSTPNTPWPIPLDQMWYSYNVGPVHFISYSTEVFFTYNEQYVCNQFHWLLEDLKLANQNRDKQPWIVAMGHRPMYCSNNDGDDCTNRFLWRWVQHGLEDLFYAQGVDLIIEAHEHSYERLWPVYRSEVYSHDYVNPRAPVHVISGAAGSQENVDWMTKGTNNTWSAFKADKTALFTFGQLEIHNHTHLYFEQRDSRDNGAIDGIWLVQETHGPFVSNLTCEGVTKHPSCFCPSLILYIYIIIAASIAAIFILLAVVVFLIYKFKCKKRPNNRIKNDDKDVTYARFEDVTEHDELLQSEKEQREPDIRAINLLITNQEVPNLYTNQSTENLPRDTDSINSIIFNLDDRTRLI